MRFELSTQILIGLALGVLAGIFFGPLCQSLSIVGDAFVGLLRMTVLPYIAITLIASLGRLSLRQSRRLAVIGGMVLLLLWAIALLTVAITPWSFPQWKSGSFFSTALVTVPPKEDLFSYFIPTNIFSALANNHVPAIILFCIFLGVSLAKSSERDALLVQLDVAADVLLRVSGFITRLAPVGIFAIAASTAGTVSLAEIARLQAYIVAYTAGGLFLGLFALPLLVTTLTPLRYGQVWRVVKEPLITAFATGKLIIVLPMLVQNTERLFRELPIESGEDQAPTVEVLYSTAYPFPHVGKLFSMLFIPFAAWFLGSPLAVDEYPAFLGTGLFAYFGGPIVAVPFLLDQMQLPHDMFQLFLVSGVYCERVGDAVGAIHLATLTMISTFGFRRELRLGFSGLIRYFAILGISGGLLLFTVHRVLNHSITVAEPKGEIIARMQLLSEPVEHAVIAPGRPNPEPLEPDETLLERIQRRGVLRVGYNRDKIPFAYFNSDDELVGYDISMAHALARDLSVRLEFVRFERATLVSQLNEDHFDIVMSGLVGTLERSAAMHHTSSYMDVNLALVTRDFRARDFKTINHLRAMDELRIGFADLSRGFADRVRTELPRAELIELDNNQDFFDAEQPSLDALLISAESGSAFTLLHPEFEVVVPTDMRVQLPLFYAVGNRDNEMRDLLEHWMTLRRKDGTAQAYYDHWILGKTEANQQPRWSVIRNVLHWID